MIRFFFLSLLSCSFFFRAVQLLLQGLRLRIERFEELETNVLQKRDALRKESLESLALSSQKK